jgi:hypothetical protein
MNCIWYQFCPKVSVEKGPHTSKCTCSQGIVVRFTGTLINLGMCLAWMQTVHRESSSVYPSARDRMSVGFIWAGRRHHSLDSGIVKYLWADLVTAVEGAWSTTEEVGAIVPAIVGDSEDSIVCSLIFTLRSQLPLFLIHPPSVLDDGCAVAGTIIYMWLTSFVARV